MSLKQLISVLLFAKTDKNLIKDIHKYKDYINTYDDSYCGITPFLFACMNFDKFSDIDIIDELVKYGANINQLNNYKQNALNILCYKECNQYSEFLIDYLIKKGINVNNIDMWRYTPIINIIDNKYKNKIKTIKLLLNGGANVDYFGRNGENIIDILYKTMEDNIKNMYVTNLILDHFTSKELIDMGLFLSRTMLKINLYSEYIMMFKQSKPILLTFITMLINTGSNLRCEYLRTILNTHFMWDIFVAIAERHRNNQQFIKDIYNGTPTEKYMHYLDTYNSNISNLKQIRDVYIDLYYNPNGVYSLTKQLKFNNIVKNNKQYQFNKLLFFI